MSERMKTKLQIWDKQKNVREEIRNTATEDEVDEYIRIIHLVHTQNFPKNKHFLPTNMHMFICVSGTEKY